MEYIQTNELMTFEGKPSVKLEFKDSTVKNSRDETSPINISLTLLLQKLAPDLRKKCSLPQRNLQLFNCVFVLASIHCVNRPHPLSWIRRTLEDLKRRQTSLRCHRRRLPYKQLLSEMREPRADFQLASFRSCSGVWNPKLHPPSRTIMLCGVKFERVGQLKACLKWRPGVLIVLLVSMLPVHFQRQLRVDGAFIPKREAGKGSGAR